MCAIFARDRADHDRRWRTSQAKTEPMSGGVFWLVCGERGGYVSHDTYMLSDAGGIIPICEYDNLS